MSRYGMRRRWEIAIREDPDVPATAQHLGLLLSTYFDDNGQLAFPSRETLRDCSKRSLDTVDRAITWFETNGYLRVTRGRGRRVVNKYELTLTSQAEARAELVLGKAATEGPFHFLKGRNRSQKRPQDVRTKKPHQKGRSIALAMLSGSHAQTLARFAVRPLAQQGSPPTTSVTSSAPTTTWVTAPTPGGQLPELQSKSAPRESC